MDFFNTYLRGTKYVEKKKDNVMCIIHILYEHTKSEWQNYEPSF